MLPIFLLVIFAMTNELSSVDSSGHSFQRSGLLSRHRKPAYYRTTGIKAPPPSFIFHLLKHKLKYPLVEKIPTPEPTASCICVPYYQCNSNNTIITDGAGIIDVRFIAVTFRRCTGELEVCCRLPSPSMAPIVTPTVATTIGTTATTTMATTTTATTTMATTTMSTTQAPTTQTTAGTTLPPTAPATPTTMIPTQPPATTSAPTQLPTATPPAICICVPITQCDANGYIIVGGEGTINPRQTLTPCPIAGQICCRLPTSAVGFPTTDQQPQQPIVTIYPPFTVGPPVLPPPPPPPVSCVCVQSHQCDANGYIIVSGAGAIDPRFPIGRQGQVAGTCVSLGEICCRISPSGQDSSIGFPGGSVPPASPTVLTIRNPGTDRACGCVKAWQCAEGNAVSLDGAGIIDPRFGACPNSDEICCLLRGITRNLAAGSTLVNDGLGSGHVVDPNAGPRGTGASAICGIRATACFPTQACATKPGETSFAEFPWMVALLVRKPDGTSRLFQCGASVINTRSVLTAAHCVIDRPSGVLVARFGEWNTANNDEPAPFQEADVQSVVTHPLYYNGGLYNDVAVLILARPIAYALNVMPVCLPQQGMTFPSGTLCWASGWGRNAFQGQYQTILRKVDLPIVDRTDCQTRLRATRLGQYFLLHGSFICAGGEPSKDTCRGDGGGPLVCPTATGQFVQAGIVSWGIGCGESNTPAVYASVSQFRQWIDQQLANYGVL